MLSGIGKIYNCEKYLFPLELSIESVLDGADEFVLVVCEDSQDNTIAKCKELEKKFNGKLKLVYSKWIVDKEEGKYNMRRLANLAIEKTKIGEKLYSGTMVVQGEGIMQVSAVGINAEIGKISVLLEKNKTNQSVAERDRERVARRA
jgi:magnesium-transporting ATPase (P-type)